MKRPGAHTRLHQAQHDGAQMRRLAIAELYRQEVEAGRGIGAATTIVRQLGISKGTVSKHLAAIRAALPPAIESEAAKIRTAIIKRIDAARARLDRVEAEITAEWHRSKLDESSTMVEQQVIELADGTRKPTGQAKVQKRTKGQTGNAAYSAQMIQLETARLALDKELREMMGVDAPTKSENTNVDLSALTDDQLARLEKGEPLAAVLRAGDAA